MSRLALLYGRLLAGCGVIAGLMIAGIAVIVAADVILRNLQVANLPWVIEVTEYSLFISTFLAAPWVLREGAHVRVDVFLGFVPHRLRRSLALLVELLGLVVSGVLLVFGYRAAHDAQALGSLIFKELIIPEWWLLSVIPICSALLFVEFARRLLLAVQVGEAAVQRPEDGL